MGKHILIVDDDKVLVEIYRKALEEQGHSVICAYNGQEGLEMIRANPTDLVILDLQMPKMTGDKFLKIIRDDAQLKDTKVIVVSSVLNQYKEVPRCNPDGSIARWDTVRKGFSRIGKRAKDVKQKEDALSMGEKIMPRKDIMMVGGYCKKFEDEKDFEKRVSTLLVKRVNETLGVETKPPAKKEGEGKSAQEEETIVEEKVREVVAKYFDKPKEEITLQTHFKDDLQCEFSFDAPLHKEIKKAFGVRLAQIEKFEMDTVGYLAKVIIHRHMYYRTERKGFFREMFEDIYKGIRTHYAMIIIWLILVIGMILFFELTGKK